jgi:hypothetical protein
MRAEIKIQYRNEKIPEIIAKAISPENFKTPKGLNIKTINKGKKLITNIYCNIKLSTFIATIDDLLFSISTAENIVEKISGK